MELKGYTSTSTDPEAAEAFIRDRWKIIQIRSGKDVRDYSNAPMENELLLPRGLKLKVEKIEFKKMPIGEPGMEDIRNVQILHLKQI